MGEPAEKFIGWSSRADFFAWARLRALEFVDAGQPEQGYASMVNDLNMQWQVDGAAVREAAVIRANGGRAPAGFQAHIAFTRSPEKVRAFIREVG